MRFLKYKKESPIQLTAFSDEEIERLFDKMKLSKSQIEKVEKIIFDKSFVVEIPISATTSSTMVYEEYPPLLEVIEQIIKDEIIDG